MRSSLYRMVVVFAVLFVASFITMWLVEVGQDSIGQKVINLWIGVRAPHTNDVNINSINNILKQAISLTFFLLVVIGSAINMEWRVELAILGMIAIIFTGVVPPEVLVSRSVKWSLVLFLAGSMTFTGLLHRLGVFRYIVVNIIRVTRRNPVLLLLLLLVFSFILSAVVGEVISVIYVVTLIFELTSLMRIDPKPLLILAVLAVNTGSLALPVGNPIGIYLFFETGLLMTTYVRYSITLALLCFTALLILTLLTERRLIKDIGRAISEGVDGVNAFIDYYYIELEREKHSTARLRYGLVMLLGFVVMVVLNDVTASVLGTAFGQGVDSHALLAFIPYIFIVLSAIAMDIGEVSKHLERSVRWPLLMFFIYLFILSYSLTYSGVMAKLAYALLREIHSTPSIILLTTLSSASIGSVLDNLLMVVTFTPIAILIEEVGITNHLIYFSVLCGSVLGGNYTPIGSSANIIAVSMAEKREARITWSTWLKTSLTLTTTQIVVALTWIYLCNVLNI